MPSASHTPLGHALRYTDECYDGMRDDVARTSAYYKAIDASTRANDIVLDIGTGKLALLAIRAAKAGAKEVYAIEVNAHVAEAARATIAAAGFADRITVLQGFSTDPHLSLPSKATLVVHELIGEVAGEEGAFHAIQDARHRFLEPHARSVPARSRTLIAPCEHPDETFCKSLPPGLFSDAAGQARALRLQGLPRSCLLAPAVPFELLDFEASTPEPRQKSQLYFQMTRAGRLFGLALHVDLTMMGDTSERNEISDATSAEEGVDVSSAWEGSHWRNVLLTLDHHVDLEAGQRLRVDTSCELGGPQPRYTFEAWFEDTSAAGDTHGDTPAAWRSLGPMLHFPEAALNCNDMMDLESERFGSD